MMSLSNHHEKTTGIDDSSSCYLGNSKNRANEDHRAVITEVKENDDKEGQYPPKTKGMKKHRVSGTDAMMEKTNKVASSLKDAMEELDRIWDVDDDDNSCASSLSSFDEDHEKQMQNVESLPSSPSRNRVRQTAALLVRVFSNELYDPAVQALAEHEELRSEAINLTHQLEISQREVKRLKGSELRSKESIQNLLKAVDRSTEEAKDSSQAKLVEAKLRADLLQTRKERDDLHHESMVSKRSLELVTNEANSLKQEKSRLQKENIRLEREARSARVLAESLSRSKNANLNNGNDEHNAEFYKRKTRDLETHLQGMTARLAEKNQELMELRHCRDRNLSQNRLEALRAGKKISNKKIRVSNAR
ncbi:unnamed protein product [Pseudo-nitzschia multistriata]|uniref:Uncharacterized protein n=1 Tax=Pseudo-nitzschia multistriata TaxID=183589 RepID=A0A448Z313_9STRA|nr:unnamed protein product [Pseudo-nitzschia multistriata]